MGARNSLAALALAAAAAAPAQAALEPAQPSLLAAAEAAGSAPAATEAAMGDRQALAIDPQVLQLRTAELGVWMILRRTEALRSGDRFDVADASLETLALLPTPPAAVPLPAAVWLFVVGLLGLVGVRVSRAPQALPAGARALPA